MPYQLISTNLETFGPTIAGLKLLKTYVNLVKENRAESKVSFPSLEEFLETGHTANTKGLATDCNLLTSYLVQMPDLNSLDIENVQSSLKHLGQVAMQAKEGLALAC